MRTRTRVRMQTDGDIRPHSYSRMGGLRHTLSRAGVQYFVCDSMRRPLSAPVICARDNMRRRLGRPGLGHTFIRSNTLGQNTQSIFF